MPIIYLFGPDGGGKSTLSEKIHAVLLTQGFKVKVSWMRGSHTFASLFARFLGKFKAFRGSSNPYYNISIPLCFRRIWQLIEFISVLPIILFRFILINMLGFHLIADRYVLDFIVWVSLTTGDYDYHKNFEAKFLLTLAAKTCVNIYVTASLKELSRRSGLNPDFLGDQLMIYDKITSSISVYKLDTTNKLVDESLKKLLIVLKTYGLHRTPEVYCPFVSKKINSMRS